MERDRRTAVATFYAGEDARLMAGESLSASEDVRTHLRARRLGEGDVVRLTDGRGHLAEATIRTSGRRDFEFAVSDVVHVQRLPAIHLRAPIADRDRMLWLGEKASELGVESWEGVRFRRSASVTPRGEGSGFVTRLRARMISALEQSGGAWLPSVQPDTDLESLAHEPALRIVMDASGQPLLSVIGRNAVDGVILLVGPEGGIEDDELAMLEHAGWRRASLGAPTLRFETAAVAAIAVARAAQSSRER